MIAKNVRSLRAQLLAILILLGSLHHHLATAQGSLSYFNWTDNEAYINWLQNSSYNKSTFLTSTTAVERNGVALHWTTTSDYIHLAVAAQATGWAGFGLAESGSMRGADIILFTAATNSLVDSYVLDQPGQPIPDECQSWNLINSTVQGGFIIFEATRRLDTNDTQDRAIIDDRNSLVPPTRVIAAWGDTSEPSYHGPNTARASVRFFESESTTDELEAFAKNMQNESEGNFTIQATNFSVPLEITHYQRFCLSRADLLAMNVPIDKALHTIGIEPILDPRGKQYVHHFVVAGSNEPWNSSMDCEKYPGFEAAYAWAPGDPPLDLPTNVGGPLGSNGGFQSFALQIHYNNPELHDGVVDTSGVRFYYTSKKRQFDLGIFETGDPDVNLFGKPLSANGGLSQHVFTCESECSKNVVSEPITVIKEHLHMHQTGVSMINTQIRNGTVVHQGKVEFWDFQQQGDFLVVQEPFVVTPGDAFRTECNYNAANGTVWGLGTQNEMCIAFLFYYPRQLAFGVLPYICGVGIGAIVPGCEAAHNMTPNFSDFSQLQRSFGTAPQTCPTVQSANAANPSSNQTHSTSAAAVKYSNSVAAFPGLLVLIGTVAFL